MPTITQINPQIGDVVEYRGDFFTGTYTMDEHGLKGSHLYLNRAYFSGSYENCDKFHVVSRAKPEKTIKVGQAYKLKNGQTYKCIFADGNRAYMTHGSESSHGPAYVWSLDGKSLNINKDYDVEWEPVVKTVEVDSGSLFVGSYQSPHVSKMTVTTVNGKPDWNTLKVEGV